MQVTEELMRRQNFFLKWRVPFSENQARVLWAILQHEGVNQSKVCRVVNNKKMQECKYCFSYANTRKQQTKRTFKPSCSLRRGAVIAAIRALERRGVIVRRRGRVTDKWNGRGWDWMKQCFCQLDRVGPGVQRVLEVA